MVHNQNDIHFLKELCTITISCLEWSLKSNEHDRRNSCHDQGEGLIDQCVREADQAHGYEDTTIVEEDWIQEELVLSFIESIVR